MFVFLLNLKYEVYPKILVNIELYGSITPLLPLVFSSAFHQIYSIVHWCGYSFTLVDANTVRHLATTDKSLLPYKVLDATKDIPWNTKKINAEVLQGILQGDSINKISDRLMNVQEMNKTQAVRSARTIVTSAECKGRQDSYEKAKQDGMIVKKYWLATYDARARDWHREAGARYTPENGIDPDDFFIVDGEKMLYPGDSAHGASGHNLYNCRCSIASKVVGFRKVSVAEQEETLENSAAEDIIEDKNADKSDFRTFSTGSDANDFFYYDDESRGLLAQKRSKYGQWMKNLEDGTSEVVSSYCSDGYDDINKYWRKVGDWYNIDADKVRYQTDIIDKAISTFSLKDNITTYRGINIDTIIELFPDAEELEDVIGKMFIDKSFMSTSPVKSVAEKFASQNGQDGILLELLIPSGDGRGAYINQLSGFQDDEYEFLLCRGARFEITEVDTSGGMTVLRGRWVDE